MKVQKFRFTWNLGFLPIYESVINSDIKTISQRLLLFFIWFAVHIQPFFNSTNGLNISTVRCSSHCVECSFKSNRKLNHDILDSLDKSKTPGHCRFPLTNLQKGPMIDFVPKVIITKNCRLHNQLFACNDFFGQRATTIYCGPAYKF